jgi:hypothetical protein
MIFLKCSGGRSTFPPSMPPPPPPFLFSLNRLVCDCRHLRAFLAISSAESDGCCGGLIDGGEVNPLGLEDVELDAIGPEGGKPGGGPKPGG